MVPTIYEQTFRPQDRSKKSLGNHGKVYDCKAVFL